MSRAVATNLVTRDHDLGAMRNGEWEDREFPLGPRPKPVRRAVVLKQSVLNDIYTHGRGEADVEVCGVLVGNVYQDAMGPFVYVEANIRGDHASGRAAQVTFTARTWSHIQDVMDRQYPHKRILGWYHTHPGHGIFLSDMDLFIHKNFFSLPWQLAFVFDPHKQEEGLFAWTSGNLAIELFAVQRDAPPPPARVARRVPDLPATQPVAIVGSKLIHDANGSGEGDGAALERLDDLAALVARPRRPDAAPAEVTDLSQRLQGLERRQRWLTAALAVLVLVAVAWPIALSALSIMQSPEDALPSWMLPESTNVDDLGEPPPAATAPLEPMGASTQPAEHDVGSAMRTGGAKESADPATRRDRLRQP